MENVDAVWLGDASGTGNDHFDLVSSTALRARQADLRQADWRHGRADARILDFLARETW
ncbi:MAG: hypothetical protein U0793_24610 [Gemmataceae bacterium]